jgi:hypothetical protein
MLTEEIMQPMHTEWHTYSFVSLFIWHASVVSCKFMPAAQPVQSLAKTKSIMWYYVSFIDFASPKDMCSMPKWFLFLQPEHMSISVKSPDISQGLCMVYHSDQLSALANQNKPHILKVCKILPFRNCHIPLSMSTSSNITIGLFPPSSSETGCHEKMKYKSE